MPAARVIAPTAAAVHPKTGDLYVSSGGRGTRGAVYRLRYDAGFRQLRPDAVLAKPSNNPASATLSDASPAAPASTESNLDVLEHDPDPQQRLVRLAWLLNSFGEKCILRIVAHVFEWQHRNAFVVRHDSADAIHDQSNQRSHNERDANHNEVPRNVRSLTATHLFRRCRVADFAVVKIHDVDLSAVFDFARA